MQPMFYLDCINSVFDNMLTYHCFWWHVDLLLFWMAWWSIIVFDGMLTHCCFWWHVDPLLFMIACWSIIVFDGILIHHCCWWHTDQSLFLMACWPLFFFWWHVDSSVLLMACWHIFVFDGTLTNYCFPSMKPTWSWCVYFNVFWIPFANILVRIFLSMLIKEIVYLFICCWVHI